MRDPLAAAAPIERIRTHLVSLRMQRWSGFPGHRFDFYEWIVPRFRSSIHARWRGEHRPSPRPAGESPARRVALMLSPAQAQVGERARLASAEHGAKQAARIEEIQIPADHSRASVTVS